jgi:hypothetical protein
MTVITFAERYGMEKGREEGLKAGRLEAIEALLELRFAADGLALMPAIRQQSDVKVLQDLLQCVKTAASLDEVRRQLPATDRPASP